MARPQGAGRPAARLVSRSAVRRSAMAWGCAPLVFGGFALLLWGASLAIMRRLGTLPDGATKIFFAACGALILFSLPFLVILGRVNARQSRVAKDVEAAAKQRRWRVWHRNPEMETGWTTRPFSALKNAVVSPGASSRIDGVLFGVGYLQGDMALAETPVKTFGARIVVADLERPLPSVTFASEGFSEKLATLFGGTDLDVESHAFNQSWRVKADDAAAAHGVLTPRVIEMLLGAHEPGTAIHLDGSRIVVWDDGSRTTVDLDARLRFLQAFITRLPAFLRPG